MMSPINKISKETYDQWHSDPNNWNLGVFYFNKKDTRLLPPKRNKWMGWTVNFANWKSIALLIAMIAFPLGVAIFSR